MTDMSMLQAQVDELRSMAESVGLAMPQAATLMMEAADAIDRLDAENAKLRSELESVGTASYLYGRSDLKAENAKLRELAAGIGHLLFPLDVDYCAICPRDDINHPCPVHTVDGGECLYETDLRELGIEVDE